MGIKEFFQEAIDAWNSHQRIKADKPVIESTSAMLAQCLEENHRRKNMDGGVSPSGRDALNTFERVMKDEDLAYVIGKYADQMRVNAFAHSLKVKALLCDVVDEISPDHVMALVDFLGKNKTFRKAVSIRDDGRRDVSWTMAKMASKCPVEEKLRFYSSLESSGILGDAWRNIVGESSSVPAFIAEVFKDVETNAALSMLKYSDAWKAYPKNQNDRDSLIHYNQERLLPALQYTNEPGPQPSPEQ